ncbi:MAG: discoidin domain-containing protein [Clostridia bacterium]|nr:discoidin domain-containing protein [Clostridia bacterium]
MKSKKKSRKGGFFKRSVLLIMTLSMIIGIAGAAVVGAVAADAPVSVFDDGYTLGANWIWADTEPAAGQWVAMRKSFTLDEVPSEFVARISADTKYWLYINGELAVFEGQLKLGSTRYNWYYDKIDLSDYLVVGENTIAVQVFYSGKTSASTINTRVPSFLFDAKGDGVSVVSDTSWRAVVDPAYLEPISLNNERNGEANIKYDASREMKDAQGNVWWQADYDDSEWGFAVNQDEKIKTNRIYDDAGKVSGVYYQDTDPRRQLVLRQIPAIKLDEMNKFTEDGANGTGAWTKTEEAYTFAPLSLPESYTVEAVVTVAAPIQYGNTKAIGSGIGICVCVKDANNLYMPQIGFRQASSFDGVRFKPHTRVNGTWNSSTTNLTNTDFGKTLYLSGSYDYRYSNKHTVKIEVTATEIKTYMNGTLLGTVADTQLARVGSTVGFRQDINEQINLYSFKVKDASGNELYDAGIEKLKTGDTLNRFSLLTQENTSCTTVYNTVAVDGDSTPYISVRNCRSALNDGQYYSTYKIVNPTNIQGTPYLKVRSEKGGELISITPDSWVNGGSSSIAHQYLTRAGEQSWEALGWMNGYEIKFTVPDGVEVIELGYRKSGYDTEETGSVVTDSETLNKLYREAYDTLVVCMRDSFMDCPDRERTQWLGDAVINMQQAAYALDDKAALLYAKTLTQAIGFVQKNGAIPSKIALGRPDLELPMQSLAGVHSFWQYYMYYGDRDLVIESYPTLLAYLKLWDVSDSGVITHRDGNWNWYDWGSHADTVIIENCWYYTALSAVLNIARLDGSGATSDDIAFLSDRMDLIARNFDTLYWNEERSAYYNSTDNSAADDRANAMAIYAGLADKSRYDDILTVLKTTYNSGPYMEKYVLDAMYMMGADDEAMVRTVNRFAPFLNDGYPTLPEIWTDQTLYSGDESKNHAWTGAPLSMLYVYNAGITPMSPAFKTFKVRPQLGTLTSVNASVTRGGGTILVSVQKSASGYTMTVTVPTSADYAYVYVPRLADKNTAISLGGSIIFANGTSLSANMPSGVSYIDEDTDFIGLNMPSGTYSFTVSESEVSESEGYEVTLGASEGGSVSLGATSIDTLPYTFEAIAGDKITVTATPDAGYRLVAILGSAPEEIISTDAISREYTVNSPISYYAVFEKEPVQNRLLTISASNADMANYALNVYVNGALVSLPYTGSFTKGTTVGVRAESISERNYSVTLGSYSSNSTDITLNENTDIVIAISEKTTVNKLPILSVTSSVASANATDWDEVNLYDGNRTSVSGALGFSTGWQASNDVSANPYVLTFDLGSMQKMNQAAMFPRSDSWTQDSSLSCNFPTDFTISVSDDGSAYRTVVTVTNGANPRFKQVCYDFTETTARYVRLTVTKLGLPAYNDGQSNDHYRLQLSEFEVYYNGNDGAVETKYGSIPYGYRDASLYPIVMFKTDKTFVGAYSNWKNCAVAAGLYGSGATDDFNILFRDSYTFDADENGAISGNNMNSFTNNVTVDLGGNTVTLNGTNFLNLYIYTNATAVSYGRVAIKNGCFITETNKHAPVCLNGGNNVSKDVTYTVDFEAVRFKVASSSSVIYGAIRTWSATSTANMILNSTFTDCIFDYTGAGANAGMLGLCDGTNVKTKFNIKIAGGEIVAGENADFNLIEKDAQDSVILEKNTLDSYLTLTLYDGIPAPDTSFTTANGEYAFIKDYSEDGDTLYKLAPLSVAQFTPKTSITLDANLIFNVYIPECDFLTAITLDGKEYGKAELTLSDGYYLIQISLDARAAARDIPLSVSFTAEDDSFSATYTLSTLKYAKKMLADSEATALTKTLVYDMLAYIKSSYAYFGTAGASEIAVAINELVAGGESAFARVDGLTTNMTVPEGVTFILDAEPKIRFYFAEGTDLTKYSFKIGGVAQEYTATAETIGESNFVCADISLFAYKMIGTVEVFNGSTKLGSFHINDYYDFAIKQNNSALTEVVERFYMYCVSAQKYREEVKG